MFYTRELTHKALVCVREAPRLFWRKSNFDVAQPCARTQHETKEILLARNFDLLDIDGDGKWTYAEALQLGQGLSRSKAGLPRMYMELVQLLKDRCSSSWLLLDLGQAEVLGFQIFSPQVLAAQASSNCQARSYAVLRRLGAHQSLGL